LSWNLALSSRNNGSKRNYCKLYLVPPKVAGAPRLALTCIQRVHLNAGETRELKFSLQPAQMSFVDLAGKRAIRPGSYRLFVGGAQPQLDQDKGVVFRIPGEKALEF
jgi:beta-glucosidase